MNQFPDLGPVIPEILLCAVALFVLVLDLFSRNRAVIAGICVVAALGLMCTSAQTFGTTFSGMFIADGYSQFFKFVLLLNLILTVLISIRYIVIEKADFGEYYGLLLFATLGMMIMASAGDLMMLYIGLELMALATYVLTGFMKHDLKSNEAAVKYLLLGAFASAFLLFGISLTYGMTGTTNIAGIASYIEQHGLAGTPGLTLALLFFIAAFGFKIAAAPFHMWAPDVYEGAPTSVTAFMSVGPKAAGFAAMGRVFLVAFGSVHVDWNLILIPIAVLTMAVGNVLALSQTNIKRMLAYSSIAHAGYALLGIIAGGAEGVAGMMSYMLIYAFMNIGAFAVVIMLRTKGFNGDSIYSYEGLSKTHPLGAALMLVFMFSLTGIPPTAGFIGKFYVFMAAIEAGHTQLVIIAVLFSAISAFYYLRIVMFMYMREPSEDVQLSPAPALHTAIAISLIGVLVIGLIPDKVLSVVKLAASSF